MCSLPLSLPLSMCIYIYKHSERLNVVNSDPAQIHRTQPLFPIPASRMSEVHLWPSYDACQFSKMPAWGRLRMPARRAILECLHIKLFDVFWYLPESF